MTNNPLNIIRFSVSTLIGIMGFRVMLDALQSIQHKKMPSKNIQNADLFTLKK